LLLHRMRMLYHVGIDELNCKFAMRTCVNFGSNMARKREV
jgi:hypothetical protein